jgi:hypothetical protein
MLYVIILVISDAVTILLAFWLAYYFRFQLFVDYFDSKAMISLEHYRFLFYSMPFLWLGIFAVSRSFPFDSKQTEPK